MARRWGETTAGHVLDSPGSPPPGRDPSVVGWPTHTLSAWPVPLFSYRVDWFRCASMPLAAPTLRRPLPRLPPPCPTPKRYLRMYVHTEGRPPSPARLVETPPASAMDGLTPRRSSPPRPPAPLPPRADDAAGAFDGDAVTAAAAGAPDGAICPAEGGRPVLSHRPPAHLPSLSSPPPHSLPPPPSHTPPSSLPPPTPLLSRQGPPETLHPLTPSTRPCLSRQGPPSSAIPAHRPPSPHPPPCPSTRPRASAAARRAGGRWGRLPWRPPRRCRPRRPPRAWHRQSQVHPRRQQHRQRQRQRWQRREWQRQWQGRWWASR